MKVRVTKTPPTTDPLLFWDGVLAGRYVDKSLKKMVCHAVANRHFKIGRIERQYMDVLCKRVKPQAMSTSGLGEPTPNCPECPECKRIAKKLGVTVSYV